MNFVKRGVKAAVNLVLYGHFWIAAAALAMTIQTKLLLWGEWQYSALDGFVAGGTLTIYALHRLVAMRLQPQVQKTERFAIMQLFQSHIVFYALVAALLAAWFFFQLTLRLQLNLLVPCAIALGYVLPLLNGRRLRDLPYLKIFLIAFAWAWITVWGPVAEKEGVFSWPILLMLIERACFVFAITIPFDIRDMALDQSADVDTLPSYWGEQGAKRISYLALFICLLMALINFLLSTYSPAILLVLLLSVASTFWLIKATHPQRHDYYFTGLLDGTMILQGGMVCYVCLF
ncbi:MAG: UbiA family prenyltransferase [Bacteroidota bacterium]